VDFQDTRGFTFLTAVSETGAIPLAGCTRSCIKTERRAISTLGNSYVAESNPYLPGTDTDTNGWTLTRKDGGGRVVQRSSYSGLIPSTNWWTGGTSLGTTITSYDGEKTTDIDPAGRSNWTRRDPL